MTKIELHTRDGADGPVTKCTFMYGDRKMELTFNPLKDGEEKIATAIHKAFAELSDAGNEPKPNKAIAVGQRVRVTDGGKLYRRYLTWAVANMKPEDVFLYGRNEMVHDWTGMTGEVVAVAPHQDDKRRKLCAVSFVQAGTRVIGVFSTDGVEPCKQEAST